jgi:hypothetical protein
MKMDRVVSFSSFEEERQTQPALAYWLSQPPDERLAEVERLRREYMAAFDPEGDEFSQRLCRSLLFVDREER